MQEQQKLEKQIECLRQTEALIHEANEAEQHLLMHILNEDIGQQLTGIALLVGVLQKRLSQEYHGLLKEADELSKLTSKCIATAKDLAKGFYPLDIEVGGLTIALEWLAQETESRFNIACSVATDPCCHFVKKHSIHIYRMIQIAILGAIRGYGAKKVVVKCLTNEGIPTVKITHDITKRKSGVWSKTGGQMDLLNSRARLIGATIKIKEKAQVLIEIACLEKDPQAARLS